MLEKRMGSVVPFSLSKCHKERSIFVEMMKKSWIAVGLISSYLLVGCSTFLEGEEPLPLYTVKSNPVKATSLKMPPLAVDLPLGDISLDTQRIAVTPSPYQRDYVAGGEWSDRLPQVVQDVLVDGFTQRWGGTWVSRHGTGLQTERLLQVEIQDFSVYYLGTASPYVQIKMVFKLVDFPNRRVIAAQTFCENVPMTTYTLYGIVEAFNKGMNTLLGKTIIWMEGANKHLVRSPQIHAKKRK